MRDGNTGEVGPRHHGKLCFISAAASVTGNIQLKLKFEQ